MDLKLDILKHYAYHFYPKGIENPFEEEYLSSEEYLTLIFAIDKARHWDMKKIIDALTGIEIDLKAGSHKVLNLTNFNFGDRCFHVQYSFRAQNKLRAISANISVLAPVFCVYFVEQNNLDTEFVGRRIASPEEFQPYEFVKMPGELKPLKERLVKLLSGFGYHFIPNEDLGKVIPDISFETIGLNNMTVFNAFFMNEPYCNM
jgi:hypothetical protein